MTDEALDLFAGPGGWSLACQGSKTKQYQQVGNAIPPLLAQAILREATGL